MVANGNPYDGTTGNEQETQLNSDMGSLSEVALSSSQGEKQLRVDLMPSKDSLYVGTLYLGQPSQPVRVIFDTGSEHLAVSSNLCTSGCANKAYNMAQSKGSHQLSADTKTVLYGSAKFQGKETEDRACVSNDQGCINFKFLSLEKGDGLDSDADGILGLSPEMSMDRSD